MNGNKNSDRTFSIIAAILFLGAFLAIIFLAGPHLGFGDSYAPGEIRSTLILDQGHLEDPSIPEGLLILPAGQPAVLKFEVYNLDPDNDIDTIEVTIPESEIISGSYEWFSSTVEHEWTYQISGKDSITFTAQDDFTGSEAGDNPYYDTSGSVDDALDFIEDFNDGDNPPYDLSEGITLSVSFNTSSVPGFKMGEGSINLMVGDLKSEEPGVPLTSFEPYPYPYIVAEDDDSYLIIELEPSTCHLEVMYGEDLLFSSTRSGDFRLSSKGFEYSAGSDKTIAALEDPGDTPVKPLVSAEEDGLTGQFVLNIYELTITDMKNGTLIKTSLISNYEDDIPSESGVIVDNDMDNDGTFNNDDDDMDGDDIPNQEDRFPEIFNRLPVVTGKSQNITVIENEVFTLMVEASDPENEDLIFNWTNDQDPEWSASGSSIDLTGFPPGEYIFYVEITDELGNSRTESVSVSIHEDRSPVISGVASDRDRIIVGEKVTLTANASDPEGKVLAYTWTDDLDPDWKGTGNPITLTDLEKGDHTFTVTVSDGWSNSTRTVKVTVSDEEKGFNWIWIIIIVVITLVTLAVVLVLIIVLRKKEKKETTTDSNEIDTFESGAAAEASYTDFYDPENPEHAVDSNPESAPIEFYPQETSSFDQAGTHVGAATMEYPQELTSQPPPVPQVSTPSTPETASVEQPLPALPQVQEKVQ